MPLGAQDVIMSAEQRSTNNGSAQMAVANTVEGAWIGITGSVSHIGDRSFVLKNEDGSVGVALGSQELRDHFYSEGRTVTVYGRVDKGFFDLKVLKARAVLMEGDHPSEHIVVGEAETVRVLTASHVPGTVVHGRVTGMTGRKVTLERVDGLIIVDTSLLSYDPMQAQPHMRAELGDLVTAQGVIRNELWSGRLMKATALEVVKMGQPAQDGAEDGMDAPLQGEGLEGSIPKN
jgi:RNase P/RNase MRP subunit p29